MAEFTEIWKNWKRMCQYQKDLGEGNCMDCPLRELECNSEYPKDQIHYDGKAIEEIIAKWAAEYPEPVYPTWGEWLYEQGVLGDKYVCSIPELIVSNVATDKVDDPIPTDLAEKLGLQPKEG